MEVTIVVLGPLPLVDEEPQGNVERLLAGAADPEVPVALAVHLDQPLLEGARLDHQRVQPEEQVGRQL